MHNDRRLARPLLDAETRVGDAIVRALVDAGIDTAFGMPGGNTGPIFSALREHAERIRTVLVREEARAGVMAETFGRLAGRPAVAIGQAAFLVHASMGAIEALLSSSPMLLLTDLSDGAPYSQHGPYQSGTGDYGAWNAQQAFGAFCKAVFVARDPVQAVQFTQIAIKHALDGAPGPVAVLYHSSALRGRVGPDSRPLLYAGPAYYAPPAVEVAPARLDAAVSVLAQAARPVIIAGNGVRVGRAIEALATLADTLGAPVATSAAGKGVFDETSDLALGVYGNFGTPVANAVVAGADAVLIAGSKLAPGDTAFENPELLDPRRQVLVQIDVEPRNSSWTFPVELTLTGQAGAIMTAMAQRLAASGIPNEATRRARRAALAAARDAHGFFDAQEFTSDAEPILPQRIIRELQAALPGNAIVTCDAGENRLFMMHWFQTTAGNYVQPAGVGGMGYALPAALAAKHLDPARPAVAVCGDGGFAIAMNSLMTALEERLPIVAVVFNNGALGWVKHGQGERNIACDFGAFDHAAIARAMGCNGIRVDRAADLGPAFRAALADPRPTVVDVRSSLQETFLKVTSPLVSPR
ncbi:MAG: thiamine pyrophosphate-binding protein [Gammaproteobacteria bacterium]